VEDNSGDVGLVHEALAEHRVRSAVTVVSDGEKAMAFLDDVDAGRAMCPDLIILDLNLPRRSGHEVLQRIRSGSLCAEVPVLVLTSSNADKDRQQAAALGATRYIRKPLLLEEFLGLGLVFRQMLESGRE
jgi:CheY-like chemotaxis protein